MYMRISGMGLLAIIGFAEMMQGITAVVCGRNLTGPEHIVSGLATIAMASAMHGLWAAWGTWHKRHQAEATGKEEIR